MKLRLLIGAALTALALGTTAQAQTLSIEPAKKSFHFGIYAYPYGYAVPYGYAPYPYAVAPEHPATRCFDERYYPYQGCF